MNPRGDDNDARRFARAAAEYDARQMVIARLLLGMFRAARRGDIDPELREAS